MMLGQLVDMIERLKLQEDVVQEMKDNSEQYFPQQIKAAEEILKILYSEEIDL